MIRYSCGLALIAKSGSVCYSPNVYMALGTKSAQSIPICVRHAMIWVTIAVLAASKAKHQAADVVPPNATTLNVQGAILGMMCQSIVLTIFYSLQDCKSRVY